MSELHQTYQSLGEMLRGSAAAHSERTAVFFQDDEISYGQLEGLSNQIANALTRDGIGRGDAVALYCINSHWYVASYFAIVKTGARVVPINLLIGDDTVRFVMNNAEVKGLIFIGALAERVAGIVSEVPTLRCRIQIGPGEGVDARALSDIAAAEPATYDIPALEPREDLAAILYTSGTTGQPKGAMLSHHNLLANVNSVASSMPVSHDDVFLTVLPMFHAFGTTVGMLAPVAIGAAIAAVPRFLPDSVADVIHKRHATVFMGVPSMYAVFANAPESKQPDFSSLRFCIAGGAALAPALMARFEERFDVTVHEGDGPTECSPVTAVNPFNGVRKPGSIGVPVKNVEMRIVDETGESVPVGEMGEIVVRGDNVMKGYFKLPEETENSFFGDWYRTGDVGHTDEDGYFYIVDRIKDLIIVNGMNVYPRMLEDVIMQHEAVAEVAVVPEPHKLHGEVPRACVVVREGMALEKSDITTLCRSQLGRHEVPKIVEFHDELPKLPTGKIMKRALMRGGEVERGVDNQSSS